jgi:hypothetical protein
MEARYPGEQVVEVVPTSRRVKFSENAPAATIMNARSLMALRSFLLAISTNNHTADTCDTVIPKH